MPTHPTVVPVATLTLNPSVDVSYTLPQLIADQKVHASRTRYDPGGNGLNVARGLHRLGIPAHACLVTAGETGTLLERLLAHHVDHLHPTRVHGETRINCTLLQEKPRAQYEVDGAGPRVTGEALEEVAQAFLQWAAGGIGVLAGSIPPGVHRTFYAQLARRLREAGSRAVVDAQSSLLQAALPERPFLIKPNRFELESLCGRPLPTLEDVAQEAQDLQREGIEYVCVSLGGEGALLSSAAGCYHAAALEVTVVSTVGAGDSMVAGLVAGLVRGWDPARMLQLGIACGSATATKPGTEIFTGPEAIALMEKVQVHKIS